MSTTAARTITFFHNPRCSTSRNAAKMLEDKAAVGPNKSWTIETVEYLKTPLSRDQVKDILGFLGADQNPKVFTEFLRKDAPNADTVEQVQEILANDPAMMQRPLVVDWNAKRAVIGRPAEAVLDIMKELECHM
ncbi:hypothetical protein BG011_007103 [Mortierella polycephala]|uniref:Arsenate reductase n=1 Tax=Mortierella polycephala TaxID=41804 RepID=A0A9P6PTK6_9FUNG|nr:hypothetical protein BG011_007103 [Mortierella polycephala]